VVIIIILSYVSSTFSGRNHRKGDLTISDAIIAMVKSSLMGCSKVFTHVFEYYICYYQMNGLIVLLQDSSKSLMRVKIHISAYCGQLHQWPQRFCNT
jgi:hypothetical protein